MPRAPTSAAAAARAALLGGGLLCALLGGAPAGAGNWTLRGSTSERLEADSNLRLRPDGEALYGSVTGIDLDLGYDTKRTHWRLGSGLRLRGYLGPGEAKGLNGLSDPRLTGSVEHNGKRQQLGADFSFLRRSTAFTQIEDTGLTSGDATETQLGLNGFWSWRPDPRNTLRFDLESDLRRFSQSADNFTPTTSYTLTGRWGRLLDPRTEAGASLSFRQFSANGTPTDTDITVARVNVDVARQLTRRHRVSVSAGIGRTWTEQTTDLGPVSLVRDEQGVSFFGDLGFDWQGPHGTVTNLGLSQSLEPSATGNLDQTTRLEASLKRPLTPRSRLGLAGTYVRRTSSASLGGDEATSQYLKVGPEIDVDLTRVWQMTVGVDLRYREDDDGTAHAAGLFLELSRPLVLNR